MYTLKENAYTHEIVCNLQKENIKKKESVFSFLDVFLFIIVYF
ncbi:hypothetical protein HMPREF9377_00448 [Enterococcus faecalis R712]|nr:hypothetical protein HMPREF9377_00448 [Enterococcus faecalis R712]EFQ10374.1 hypothetical protein HMPREF9492_01157 [Enterococcus faecalis DAPTO 512]EFQ66901.1 hypothetical protein HMPREF9493_02501 [Enterococcus faecalis DAPTO 516]